MIVDAHWHALHYAPAIGTIGRANLLLSACRTETTNCAPIAIASNVRVSSSLGNFPKKAACGGPVSASETFV